MKNPCGKMRKKEDPYEIWEGYGGLIGWRWLVLKKYQTPDNEATNPYARWMCFVSSPMCPDGEYGDTYIKDVISSAKMVKGEADLRKVLRDEVDKKNIF